MRLMVLTPGYPPIRNAPSVRMSEMVAAFVEEEEVEHITVLVYKPGDNSERFRREVKLTEKVTAIYYATSVPPWLPKRLASLPPFTLARWTSFAIREARRASPDLILATIPPRFNPAIAAYFASLVCRIPFCIDIRDFWEGSYQRSPGKLWFLRAALTRLINGTIKKLFLRACRKALLISVVTQSIGEYLTNNSNVGTPVVVIPNGINVTNLEIMKTRFDRCRVLSKNGIPYSQAYRYVIFAGKVGEYYKPEVLLKPLRDVRDKGWNIGYIIVGEGPSKRVLADMAGGLDIKDSVFLLGALEHSRVLELLLASDVGFFPLGSDHPYPGHDLSAKVLEYIACRLPILSITHDKAAVLRLVPEHGIGVALTWDEEQQIEEALEKLLDKSEDYVRNIERYYPAFVEEFDRRKNNQKLFEELWSRWNARR